MLKLMYITPDPAVATIAMECGVDRIFIDMEVIGKEKRQGGLNTVQSKHTFDDILAIKSVMQEGHELLVRSNPIHDGSKAEIEKIIECGADIVMLPYFQRADQVQKFVDYVGGRAKAMLLIESREAIENLDDILAVEGVDEYHVGLNDLHLDYGMKFMFEPLITGLLDEIIMKISKRNKSYGFGGVARIGEGMLPGEAVVTEHYRLGSSIVILARAFCNSTLITDHDELRDIFQREVAKLRDYERDIEKCAVGSERFRENHEEVVTVVNKIING